MKGLILAGGHGTRLRPITYSTNKHLIPLANKPMLHYVVETMKNAGITDIGVIVGHTDEVVREIKDDLGDGRRFGVKITYIFQDAPRGLAHAVKTAKSFLTSGNDDGLFVVHLGDNIIGGGIKGFLKEFSEKKPDAMVLLKKIPNPQRFGVAKFEKGKLVGLVEKPKNPPSDLALVGVYFLNGEIFDSIDRLKPSSRNEYEITEAIQGLINRKKTVMHRVIETGWWKDPGDPDGVIEANRLMLEELKPKIDGKVDKSSKVSGKVVIEAGAVVKNGSVIIGPAIIGKNSVIDSAHIGKHTSVGDDVEIKGAKIEDSVIMRGAKISCSRKISHSLIGRDAQITGSSQNGSKEANLVLGEKSKITI